MTDTIKISRELRPVLSITDEQLAEIDRTANGACQYSRDDWFSFHDFLAFYASDDAEFLSAVSPWVVIALITRLRAAENKLRALEPIAADMGGQAGEEVTQQITIVQHLDAKGSRKALGAMNARLRCKVGHLERKIAEQCEELEILNKQLDRFRSQSHGIPALAEHERLSEELAQHRQQAGKLVEALRQVRGYTDSPHVVGVIDEALADWEKTSCGK